MEYAAQILLSWHKDDNVWLVKHDTGDEWHAVQNKPDLTNLVTMLKQKLGMLLLFFSVC